MVTPSARWYEPAAGRFLDEYPIGFADGPNPYRYAGNDPINFYDPSGLSAQGNPLNNLYSGLGSLGPTYSSKQLFGSTPSLSGPSRSSSAFRSNDYLGPVNSQADYDRMYGPKSTASLGNTNLLNSNVLGTPTTRPGDTVVVPESLRNQNTPEARYATYKQRQAADAEYRSMLEALDRQKAERAFAARFNGPEPGFNTVTEQSRFIDLQYKVSSGAIISPQERHDYDKMSLANAGRMERIDIALGALAGFAGGYQASPGTLNIYEAPTQVRTQQTNVSGPRTTVRRTGPQGVVPGRHNANVQIRGADGTLRSHTRLVSGSQTPEELALGFPKGMLASHTEARAVRGAALGAGDRMVITGQLPPCNPCRGVMNQAVRDTGGQIINRWRENGVTRIWTAGN